MNTKNKSQETDRPDHLGSKKLLQYILSRDAVIIYSPKLEKIVWSNTSGANLFGGCSITEFLAVDIVPNHPFLNQVKTAVRQLGNERICRGFRVVKNEHSRFLQCEIGFIKLKKFDKRKNHQKLIIITAANPAMEDLSEYEFASQVLDNMADIGDARAICDQFGLIISATDSFADLGISSDIMEEVCTQFNESLKSSTIVPTREELATPLNLYALAGESGRILVYSDAHTSEGEQSDNLTDVVNPPVSGSVIELPVEKQEDTPAQLDNDVDELETLETVNQTADSTLVDEQFQESDVEERSINGLDEEQVNEPETGSSLMDNNIIDEREASPPMTENKISNRLEQISQKKTEKAADISQDAVFDETQEEFVFSGGAEPIRFAWITDTNQVFTFVSEELADAVGPNAADIVGRKWSDVATVFGFDKNSDIHSLLQNQDTWSGKSVLWPVQGTDLQVPVDLAALPTFSSGRNFDGFRGFGIVRMLDTIVDPEETGLALVAIRAPEPDAKKSPVNEVAHKNIDPDNIEEHDKSATNIVNLDLRRETKPEEPGPKLIDESELTNKENRAFNEIGQKLRETTKFGDSRLSNEKNSKTGEQLREHESLSNQQQPENLLTDANQLEEDNQNTSKQKIATNVDTSMLSELPVPVLVYRENETLFANNELLALTGYDNFQQLSEAGGITALFTDDAAEELANEHEIILKDRDGGQMYVKALLQNIPWDNENAMLLSFRQPKHETLPENEKIVLDMMRVSELNNILDTATDGIIILDRDGMVQSVNQSAEALFGRSEENVIDQSINNLFASESHQRIADLLKNLREANSQSLINDGREVVGIEAKGGLIPLFATIGKVGTSDNYCVVLRDMTPWKKTREELVDAKKQAEDASEQKTEFLARISHEIRTPLNAIIGFSDVMIEERFGPIDNERYREYLRDINRSGIHVLDLINDLLDISKIEAGKMELSFEAVDLNQIVGETVALLQPQANGNRVIIRTSLSRAVPKVVADARSIRQIVLNLVSNAIKFTEPNGQVIVSTVYEGNGEVALRVRDTGRGMSEEDIAIALKPFRQLNAISETRGQGTGLGLPLTKALVEANKAHFDIESKSGEGTIVLIQFPTQRVLAD